MPRYKVNHRYSSGRFGPYEEGNEIELSAEEAEWVNHDSPGALDEVDQNASAKAKRERNMELAKMYERNKARDLPGNAGAVLADGPVRSVGGGDVSAHGDATWDKDYGNPGPNPPLPLNDDVEAVKAAQEAGAEFEKIAAEDEEQAQAEREREEQAARGTADEGTSGTGSEGSGGTQTATSTKSTPAKSTASTTRSSARKS